MSNVILPYLERAELKGHVLPPYDICISIGRRDQVTMQLTGVKPLVLTLQSITDG